MVIDIDQLEATKSIAEVLGKRILGIRFDAHNEYIYLEGNKVHILCRYHEYWTSVLIIPGSLLPTIRSHVADINQEYEERGEC